MQVVGYVLGTVELNDVFTVCKVQAPRCQIVANNEFDLAAQEIAECGVTHLRVHFGVIIEGQAFNATLQQEFTHSVHPSFLVTKNERWLIRRNYFCQFKKSLFVSLYPNKVLV